MTGLGELFYQPDDRTAFPAQLKFMLRLFQEDGARNKGEQGFHHAYQAGDNMDQFEDESRIAAKMLPLKKKAALKKVILKAACVLHRLISKMDYSAFRTVNHLPSVFIDSFAPVLILEGLGWDPLVLTFSL